jgi:putative ABC transport system substrate-binding protein
MAQPARAYRVGVILHGGSYYSVVSGLRDGLRELGFEERSHYVLDVRDAKGDFTAVGALARSLEAERVDLIYAITLSVTFQVRQATKSVPIVFYTGADPVAAGMVDSLSRPGGRLTGVHGRFTDLAAKRLQLLKEMIPALHRVITFYNPQNPVAREAIKEGREAARRLNLILVERHVGSIAELQAGLNELRPGEADAFYYVADSMIGSRSKMISEAAMARKLPTMFTFKEHVHEGALASYGPSYFETGRLCAKYVQRILRGASPGDLPVEQYDRVQLVINLKTAKALGLTIPEAILVRADELLE